MMISSVSKFAGRVTIFLSLCLFLATSLHAENDSIVNPAKYVNPFIGTAGGGHTYPGAVVPWGMVSVSPHNTFSKPAGYTYGEKYFYGFGHVHLSGVGCSDWGSVVITAVSSDSLTDPEDYKTTYSDEKASPGYYSLYLDDLKIKAEGSATKRCGVIRFIPDDAGKINIVVDAGRNLAKFRGGEISIISGNTIEGYNISGGFCGDTNKANIYFSIRFSKNYSDVSISKAGKSVNSTYTDIADSSSTCNLVFDMEDGESLVVKTGISYVSIANARENLETEIAGLSFDQVKENAEQDWNKTLSRLYVEGGTQDSYVNFYTALYHMLIHPNVISDVNGEYPLMGRNGNGKYTDRERYSVFSLWDTYRTLHPFLSLVYPEKQSEIIKTMIDMALESGYLPRWELAGNETYVMVGDPSAIVISDSYVKGITDFDIQKACDVILKPTLLKEGELAPTIRVGYDQLLKYGYIPFKHNLKDGPWIWGPVSTTLEYNLSDWSISQMLSKAGKKELSGEFLRRSLYYKNLFDKSTMFIRPKLKDGNWLEPFDPLIMTGAGDWAAAGGYGYCEGNAWHYTWFVPHDIPGLIELFGGEKQFAQKLFECFNNNQFTVNNEPDFAYPYLFNYVKGEEYRTRKLVKEIINKDFNTGPNGLPGNDDCGTTSGWLVYSMLGFYPDCPASDFYQAGIPAFSKSVIYLNNKYYPGEKIIIEKTGDDSSETNTLSVNGINTGNFKLSHKEITSGAVIRYELK